MLYGIRSNACVMLILSSVIPPTLHFPTRPSPLPHPLTNMLVSTLYHVYSNNGDEGAEALPVQDWLDDYTAGTNFEIYSVPLEVISEESRLWNMSFSRQARWGWG